jgi:hypothetical protein
MTGGSAVREIQGEPMTRRTGTGLRVTSVLLVIIAMMALLPGGVLAKGKPGGGTPVGSGTVVAAPNPVAYGGTYTISGSGWAPNSVHAVKITTPTATQYLFAFVDGAGRFMLYNNTYSRGTFPVEVWQSGVRKPAREASTSITVF